MTIRAYLDNNATTRPLPAVVAAVRECMQDCYLNPSSAAAALLQQGSDPAPRARRALGRLLGTGPEGFLFTSGASEANSWVASNVSPGSHVVASAIEHPSLRIALQAATRRGARVSWVAPDANGVISVDAVLSVMRSDTALVSVMLANNETGAVQPIAAIAEAARKRSPQCLVHTDATQAVGRMPLDLDGALAEVDLVSMSAHKLHGPRGVGALYVRQGIVLDPLVHGEQSEGQRGGTHNSPGIAGFAVAADAGAARMSNWLSDVLPLRRNIEARLLHLLPGSWVNAAKTERLPNTISITWPGLDAADLVDRLALAGVCVSTGAACSAGAREPSPALISMGLSHTDALATLRLSLSLDTTSSEVDAAVCEIAKALGRSNHDPLMTDRLAC
ncbi:cysteine desulfurase family protein [Mesorhizobium sp. BAC0120]|uniref:cysteine desulfurase family protein n=1 Tax=Mesorhizobium sp. BAC0120 TaxID=3090670 RepID=UPI00298D54A3|nr:cysteine desulfurase family protein [Mesorhizobium sp. BAC0120]MDW6023922.1 cysteine desulfurase family protein [Mesorhizobium sp. BAC0120]